MNPRSTSTRQAPLNSAAEELRRKVLIARIIAVAGLVLVISIVVFVQWLGSDAGTVGKVEFSLKNDHSQRNVLECLATAEKLNKSGKSEYGKQIERAVDNSLSVSKEDPRGAARTYLELARALQKERNESFAFKYAIASLKRNGEAILKAASKDKGAVPEILGQINDAADIAVTSKQTLSNEDMDAILPLADSAVLLLEREGRDRLFDLVLSGLVRDTVSGSDATVRCMFAKDRMLARSGPLSELDKSASRSLEAVNKLQSDTTLRRFPDPCLLAHLVDLAQLTRNRDANFARRYLDLAEQLIAHMDRTQQNELQQEVMAECRQKMSQAYISTGDKAKGLACAREAASLRSLQDAGSAACTNQLIYALLACGQSKDAEPLAAEAYTFYKSKEAKNADVQNLRGAFIAAYFQTLVGLKKNTQAVTLMNDEIKEQRKHLPGAASTVIELNVALTEYYLKRSELKNAAAGARQIAECTKHLQGPDRVHNDMIVIKYAAVTKTPELSAEACSDALSTMAKVNRTPMDQEWIDGLCLALDNLRKSDANELYQQVLGALKNGFSQQLIAKNADAVALARVVNDLGTSGEARTADALRTEAIDKLPEAKGNVFRSHSMDFVVEGEKESAQYAEPQSAAKVYLDLAHSMLNKDNDAASKNAYEALKIYHVLAKKSPDLRERLLDSIEDASSVMVACKIAPTIAQQRLCYELSTLEESYIKKTGKGHVLDLAFSPQSKDEPLTEETLGLLLLRGEALARRGQGPQLEALVNQTKDSVIEYQKNGGFTYANYLIDLADLLAQHQQQLPARRMLNASRRIFEEIPSRPPEPIAGVGAGEAGTPGTKSGVASPGNGAADGGEVVKPAIPIPEIGKQCAMWDRLAVMFIKVGDRSSAVSCAKRSVALRPPRDAASGNSALILVDGLVGMRNYAEAEPVALDLLRFAKAQGTNAAYMGLRSGCVRRLFQIMNAQQKDAVAIALMREELDARRRLPAAPPLQTVQLYNDMAAYYLSKGDNASLAECLAGIRHCKQLLTPDEKVQWEKSGMQRDLISMALKSNEQRVAAEEIADLVTYRSVDKGALLKAPGKWWLIGLNTYKSGDPKIYQQVLDFVRQGFSQQLARPDADAVFLADVLTDLGALGEVKLAVELREEAKRKLPAARGDVIVTRAKGLPSEPESPKEDSTAAAPAPAGNEKTGTTGSIPATKTEHRPEGGRLDASDD